MQITSDSWLSLTKHLVLPSSQVRYGVPLLLPSVHLGLKAYSGFYSLAVFSLLGLLRTFYRNAVVTQHCILALLSQQHVETSAVGSSQKPSGSRQST